MVSTIEGRVVDSNGRPVAKTKISLKGKVVAESAIDGLFSVSLPRAASRVALTFAAEGHVWNTRVYDSRAATGNIVIIWPVAYRVKFDPARELDIELGSSRIQIPAKVLAGSRGEKLDGPVELQFTWFDVTSPFQRAAAPGDFSGKMLDGSIQRLNSYGIFDLALRDAKERPLSLGRGAKVDLSIIVPPRLTGKPPKDIGFFDFDLVAGRWIEAGTFKFAPATLTYNGSVTSFPNAFRGSGYNLDQLQETTCVTVQVITSNPGVPFLPNAQVTVEGKQYTFTGTTDSQGFVCLVVERNAPFTVTASAFFGGSYYATQNPTTLLAPNIASDGSNCGDPINCPLVGNVEVDLIPWVEDLGRSPASSFAGASRSRRRGA